MAVSHRLARAGLLILALAISGAVLVALMVVMDDPWHAVVAGCVLVVLLGLWFSVPSLRRVPSRPSISRRRRGAAMTRFGYLLSSEEHPPEALVAQALLAERHGFEALWISDHFHPWNDEQGNSPFVWSVLGALSQRVSLPVTTAVTCPTVRIHPAIVAQAAATAALLLDGRFVLGVGSGEALNEQVLGAEWPLAESRLGMLEEAVGLMRALWSGEVVTHHGRHFTVEHARLYTLPDKPVPVYVSAFGDKAMDVATRIGDGYISTTPDAGAVTAFRAGAGPDKPTQAGVRVSYGPDRAEAVDTAHRLWASGGVPGELSQVLRTPEHSMQASTLVTRESTADSVVCGGDVDEHVAALQDYVDAGFDEVYVGQMGPRQEEFFRFYGETVLPRLRGA